MTIIELFFHGLIFLGSRENYELVNFFHLKNAMAYEVSSGRNNITVTLLQSNNCYKGGKKKELSILCAERSQISYPTLRRNRVSLAGKF